MPEFKYEEITKKIIGAAMKVHSTPGNGFQEVIYQRALELEFTKWELAFIREFSMPIFYDKVQIGKEELTFLLKD